MKKIRPRTPMQQQRLGEDQSWWEENREHVETQFINLLMAADTRVPYTGPERRSRTTMVVAPEDAALAREQARRLGVPFEEHVRRLFHQAIEQEQARLASDQNTGGSKLAPCSTVESWRLTSARSA